MVDSGALFLCGDKDLDEFFKEDAFLQEKDRKENSKKKALCFLSSRDDWAIRSYLLLAKQASEFPSIKFHQSMVH